MGKALVGNAGTERCNAVTNRPYTGCNVILLWLARSRGWATPRFLTFKQALEIGGYVRKGEHGTKVYFVKQLQVQDDGDGIHAQGAYDARVHSVQRRPMRQSARSGETGKPMRVRNPDTRDVLADEFLYSTGATFARGMARLTTCRAMISSPCRRS